MTPQHVPPQVTMTSVCSLTRPHVLPQCLQTQPQDSTRSQWPLPPSLASMPHLFSVRHYSATHTENPAHPRCGVCSDRQTCRAQGRRDVAIPSLSTQACGAYLRPRGTQNTHPNTPPPRAGPWHPSPCVRCQDPMWGPPGAHAASSARSTVPPVQRQEARLLLVRGQVRAAPPGLQHEGQRGRAL